MRDIIEKYINDGVRQQKSDDVRPLDTKIFKKYFDEYENITLNVIEKANDKLYQNIKNWLKQNNVNEKNTPEDVKQWIIDDIGEYVNTTIIPDYMIKRLYSLIEK